MRTSSQKRQAGTLPTNPSCASLKPKNCTKKRSASENIPSEYTNTIPTPQKHKGLHFCKPLFYLAEAQRFELWNPFGSPVFKTVTNSLPINKL
ncbi:hypothetical protein EZ305_14020 [Salmonella enterica]|nr:hypothetical protein [Salmonella enterica]